MPNGMIERNHPKLSVDAQCCLLSISGLSFFCSPIGETDTNLSLMLKIDKRCLDTPFGGVRQMTWHLRNDGHPENEKRIRRLMRLMGLMPIYQVPNTSKPGKGTRPTPICCAACALVIPIRFGAPTSPTSLCGAGFCIWWRLWTGTPDGAGLAHLKHSGDRRLCRGTERSNPPLWAAGHHEHGPGIAVHILRLDRPVETGGLPYLAGWQSALHRCRSRIAPFPATGKATC